MAHLKHTQDMIRLAEKQIAAQQARISLLEDLATTDDLTGIKNRRGFYEAFLRELECCRRGSSNGGLLVMIDLDNFKAVNDTYGHLAGDAVLKLVARTLIGEIRRTDIAARLGGDEFVLLLSNTTIGDSTARAQAIGWQMNNLSLAWDGHIIPVQASLGVKPFADGDEPEDVLSSTDGMLYAMKAERKKIPKG
jgi:diguanylate cyclase (GGDEF)-like protein